MIIGDLSPTLGEYFVMKDGDNTVYTMYDFKVDTLKKPISYYKEFNRFNINIDNINDIKIVRSDETIEIRILSNINNNTNKVWEIVQPYQSGANDDYIDNKILAPIEEISLTTPIENADGDGNVMFTGTWEFTPKNPDPLPSTGGIGTHLFIIVGAALMAAAAIAFVRNSKNSNRTK